MSDTFNEVHIIPPHPNARHAAELLGADGR